MLKSFDNLVLELFGSIAEGVPLSSAASGLSEALGCHVTGLHHEGNGASRVEIGGALGLREMAELGFDYERRFQGQNPWIVNGASALHSVGYESTERIISRKELLATPYYQHILRRMDVGHAVGINLSTNRSELAVLSFNRTDARGALSRAELRLVADLRPHLLNAYAIYDRIAALDRKVGALSTALDCSPFGVIAFASDGEVLQTNAAADNMLSERTNGIAFGPGRRLELTRPGGREALASALDSILGPGALPPLSVRVSGRADGARRNLVLHLCRVPRGSVFHRGQVIGLLVETDSVESSSFGEQALKVAFDFTDKEAQVTLALRSHGDPEAAAKQLGMQLSTVRSHLKRAFCKAGVTKQAELVRIADRLSSTAPHTS